MANVHTFGQNLFSVLNDPDIGGLDFGAIFATAPVLSQVEPVQLSEFADYISNVSEPYDRLRRHKTRSSGTASIFEIEATIPPLFLQPGFDLRSGVTWTSAVGEGVNSVITQERLSAALDVVEAQLAKGIAQRADEFFAAMSTLQVLQNDIAATNAHVQRIHEKVKVAVDPVAALGVYALVRQRENAIEAYRLMQMIAAARQAQPTVQMLMRQRDFAGALDLISRTAALFRTGGILAGVACLRHTASQLTEVAGVIARILAEDLAAAAASVEPPDAQQLQPIIAGLLQSGKLADALEQYRTAVSESMKTMLKDVIPNSLATVMAREDGSEELQPGRIRDRVKSLSSGMFVAFFNTVTTSLSTFLHRASATNAAIATAVNVATADMDETSATEARRCASDSHDVLRVAVERAHSRVSALLQVRSAIHAKFALQDFVPLYERVCEFVESTEKLSGHSCIALRGEMQQQVLKFLASFHSSALEKMTHLLDHEQWIPAAVPPEMQSIVKTMVGDRSPTIPLATGTATDEPVTVIDIAGKGFRVPGACLMLLPSLDMYLRAATALSAHTPEIVIKVVELLQRFNSQTYLLVLQAGATTSAGLTNITVKHLATAAQSLDLLAALVPYVRAQLAKSLADDRHSLLNELEKVVTVMGEHRHELLQKILSIMAEIVERSCQAMLDTPWDDGSVTVSAYAAQLVRNIKTLHGICSKILSQDQVRSVFARVQQLLSTRIGATIASLPFRTDSAQRKVLADVKAIGGCLRQLNVITGMSALEETCVAKFGGAS
eukprot:TRINITY_DN2756_c0_g1_i2.p1 TRINITY_DN2756_c0_g1~~TRINITY_DN2756_c0_g1_i2.p1  ORF type:complete len:781 (-),score=178.10 TRINITY_DN2756_c0_g1_i2:381-2723(-)